MCFSELLRVDPGLPYFLQLYRDTGCYLLVGKVKVIAVLVVRLKRELELESGDRNLRL